jgi:hypothetical protein
MAQEWQSQLWQSSNHLLLQQRNISVSSMTIVKYFYFEKNNYGYSSENRALTDCRLSYDHSIESQTDCL